MRMNNWKSLLSLLSVVAALGLWSAAPAQAQAPAPGAAAAAPAKKDPKAERKMSMEAVTEADFKKIEGGPLLLAAYGVVWVLFFAALVFTFIRMRRVRDEVARLQADLDRGSAP